MSLRNVREGKLLYHLTKVDNLESIIKHGLVSRRYMIENKLSFKDIADIEIIDKRRYLGLNDYVPLHFHPHSAFDTAIKSYYSDENFMYICVHRDYAKENGFKIIIKHPLAIDSLQLYNYDDGIEAIDWDSMHTYGNEIDYIKNVKMAECLIDRPISINEIHSLNVKDDETRILVERVLRSNGIINTPYINVQKWF